MRTLLAMAAVALSTLLATPAFAKDRLYTGAPYDHDGVSITAEQIKNDGHKIWFRLNVVNNSGKNIVVDRNQIQARLPDGTIEARETGSFGGGQGQYYLAAGMSHPVHVEFRVPNKDVAEVDLVMKGILIDGKALELPDFSASAK